MDYLTIPYFGTCTNNSAQQGNDLIIRYHNTCIILTFQGNNTDYFLLLTWCNLLGTASEQFNYYCILLPMHLKK